jgi:hypothetical protein
MGGKHGSRLRFQENQLFFIRVGDLIFFAQSFSLFAIEKSIFMIA